MTARRAEDLSHSHERELVLAFKAGKSEAYAEIYDLYLPRARSICRRMLGDDHDAQEACQEVFLRVFQGLSGFNGRYQLGAWIARIATNHCLDVLRSRSRRPGDTASYEELEDGPEPVEHASDPEVVYIRRAEGRRVRRVLNSLPPLHRAAIVLRDFEGLSYAEISDILDISECKLKSLLHRARKGFKRSWPREAAQVLIPGRFLARLRKGDVEPHEHVPHTPHAPHVPPTPATTQVAEAVSSATPFVSSCVGALQQCGAAVTERVASLVTVAVVGTASVSAAASLSSPAVTEPPPPVAAASPAEVGEERLPAKRAATRAPAKSTPAEEPPAAEASPSPTPTPEATPSPTPTPSPSPTTGEGGAAAPKPTPSPAPSPPPEPSGYALGMRVDMARTGEPCDCMKAPATLAEEVWATSSGLERFNHTTEGSAMAAGSASYGMWMEHTSVNADHGGSIVLHSREGSFNYEISGGLVRRTATDWGGFVYRYEGSYRNTGRPGRGEGMPSTGAYVAEVTISWRQQRITNLFVDFVESKS